MNRLTSCCFIMSRMYIKKPAGNKNIQNNQGLQHMRKEVEVGTLLLGNYKISVVADKVLSYF